MATAFVRAANPIWYMVDLVGTQLNDQFFMFTLQNTFPYLPQPIFTDVDGLFPWSDPIQFLPNGTLPDNMYWDDTAVYRLEIRRGPSQSDPLVYEVNNFVPGSGGAVITLSGISGNQISNGQFSIVNFDTPLGDSVPTLLIATAGTYNVAPGWILTLTGMGTAKVSQVILNGDDQQINNPAYALQVSTNGWTTAVLSQTFNGNGALFASVPNQQTGIVYGSITAEAVNAPYTLTMLYTPSVSSPTAVETILSGIVNTSVYQELDGVVEIPESTNTSPSNMASVTISLQLQGTGIINLTNVQINGQALAFGSNLPAPISYQQQTINEEINGLSWYYVPRLVYKQIPSYLTGWDFPLNPGQFAGVARAVPAQAVGANKSYYAWDQTILFQSANSGITVSSGPAYDLKLLAAVTGQMAVIQYLAVPQVNKILNDLISLNLSAASTVALGGGIGVTVSLWYTKGSALPSAVISNLSIVATLDSNGKPATFNNPTGGTWIEVPPLNDQEAMCVIGPSANSNFNDYSFNGFWNLSGNSDANDATFFAIVIGTQSIVANDYLRINSVGLQSGSIATRPAPQTTSQALRDCQFYYEQSYPLGVAPGTVTANGQFYQYSAIDQTAANAVMYEVAMNLPLKQTKYQIPAYTFYDPSTLNAVGHILMNISSPAGSAGSSSVAATQWTIVGDSVDSLFLQPNVGTAIISPGAGKLAGYQGATSFHYIADARIGY